MAGVTNGSTTSFGYDGQIDPFSAPAAGTYRITATGGAGNSDAATGGFGAIESGDVTLTQNEALSILVGEQGGTAQFDGEGGGGGSFVVVAGGNPTPLVVAGGGGGASGAFTGGNGGGFVGSDAGVGQGGNNGQSLAAGDNGGGGGGGGGGLINDGTAGQNLSGNGGGGGLAFLHGGAGGAAGIYLYGDGNGGPGGFGGGGGGGANEGSFNGGGGGGGGYTGGNGGLGVGNNSNGSSSTGGTSYDSGTNQLHSVATSIGSGSVTISQLFAPVVINESGFSINYGTALKLSQDQLLAGDTDPQQGSTPNDKLTVTAVAPGSGAVLNPDGSVTFTAPNAPVAGNTASFGFTVTDTDGLSSKAMATISLTSAFVASVITVPAADQNQTSTGLTPVTPFAGVNITDANTGSPTETVTITPSSTTSGTLSDSNAASDGSKTSNGTITLTGSASAVTTEIDGLKFTAAFGQFGKTSFTIADTNSAGQTTTPAGTASVTVNPPPPPTTAQLKQIGTDILQFYKDTVSHQSTAADTTKLVNDFTATDVSQAELGQLLGQTLTSAMLSSSAATTLGTDIAGIYYPKITADLSHAGAGLANDLSAMIVTTAAAGADDLLRVHYGQSASQALTGTLQDFKIG